MNVEVAPRGYRSTFSANYRALFPDGERHYRVDVLEASVDQQFDIWVNGEKFELSVEAIACAQALQRAWFDIVEVLDRWPTTGDCRPMRGEFIAKLATFDAAWAGFEQRYISELIAIEERARKLVVRAIDCEAKLPISEVPGRTAGDFPASAALEEEFLKFIATLNSIANYKRKGRDDLGVDILRSARAVLKKDKLDSTASSSRAAARVLAGDVVASYTAMRSYFRKVKNCIEHVDPHLCNNSGLVARLVDYEETWEIGARYVLDAPMLDAICDVVCQVREVERLAPELTTMIQDCDVELFMVLPRLVMLCFLAEPRAKRVELVRSLLPHRFGPTEQPTTEPALWKVDPELKGLYSSFKEAVKLLGADLLGRPEGSPQVAAWEELARQAVRGERNSAIPKAAQTAARDLLRSVETWSLELQRHCPEDWNQCSAVLVHCLTGGVQKESAAKFVV